MTSNDAGDTDPGTNNLQNFPVLNSAVRFANGVTTVAGSLNSTASTGFTIELFMAVADASGHGEGQILVSTPQNITTNSAGNKTFTFQLGNLAAGMSLTATATVTAVSNGSTSEFSANTTVFQAP